MPILDFVTVRNGYITGRVQDYLDSKTRYRNDVITSLHFG